MPPRVRRSAQAPDRAAALEQYRRRARVYDLELRPFEPIRRRAIAWLGLAPGDTVLDVGCGTGMSFELLQRQVGPAGRIVGIEQSPEMIERARERVRRHGWTNVTLVNAPVEDAKVRGRAHAALFHFTHDILRQPRAVENVLSHLQPGATVVAAGLKWASRWAPATNLAVLVAARHSISTLEGLRAPWSHLARLLDDLEVKPSLLGGVYLARGRWRGRGPRRTTPA